MAIIKDPLDIRWRDKKAGITGVRLFSQDGARAAATRIQRWPKIKQTFARNNAAIVTAWRNLSGPQQDAWHTFGSDFPGTDKYGDPISWGGFQWYTRCNSRLLLAKSPPLSAPPVDWTPEYTPSFYCWFHEATAAFFLGFHPPPTGDQWFSVARTLHRPRSSIATSLPMYHVGWYRFPAFNTVMVAYIPGPYTEPERHWCRAVAGDAKGCVDETFYCSVETGPTVPPEWEGAAVADTGVMEDYPDDNYGGDVAIQFDSRPGTTRNALFRFDCSDIPTDAHVWSARLGLHAFIIWGESWLTAHRVLVDWEEMQATWNVRKTAVPWGAPGGEAGVDFVRLGEDAWYAREGQWDMEWDVTEMCRAWVANPASNRGVWIRYLADRAFCTVWSREGYAPEDLPYLSVAYTE